MTRREQEQINKLLTQTQALSRAAKELQTIHRISLEEYQKQITSLKNQLQREHRIQSQLLKDTWNEAIDHCVGLIWEKGESLWIENNGELDRYVKELQKLFNTLRKK